MADIAALVSAMHRIGDDLARHIKPALKVVLVEDRQWAADERLTVHRLSFDHHFRQRRVVDRYRAPAQKLKALFLHDARPGEFAKDTQTLVLRHEHIPDCVTARGRQREAQLSAFLLKEVVRDLNQHARAVACQGIGANRSAMLQVL